MAGPPQPQKKLDPDSVPSPVSALLSVSVKNPLFTACSQKPFSLSAFTLSFIVRAQCRHMDEARVPLCMYGVGRGRHAEPEVSLRGAACGDFSGIM